MSCFEVWKHLYCFNTTPLVRSECALGALEAALSYLSKEHNVALWRLVDVMGEGPVQNLLTELCDGHDRAMFVSKATLRAEFRPCVDADTYLRTKSSIKTRKNVQRLARRLEDNAPTNVEHSAPSHQPAAWSAEFLRLDGAGWRADAGTAMDADPAISRFFREVTERSLPKSKMSFLRLRHGATPVAMVCDFEQRGEVAHFRTAYDEAFAAFSPGLQLEFANIERMHASGIDRADSCADPDHSMINRIWSDRVRMQCVFISLGGAWPRIAVSLLPLLQAGAQIARTLRRRGR